MKDCTKEFSITDHLMGYFIIFVICYLLTRLFFYILWKKYNGDDKVLRDKTDSFFGAYDSVMWMCKLALVLSAIPFINIFVMIMLIAADFVVLVYPVVDKVVTNSWIPKKTKDKLK